MNLGFQKNRKPLPEVSEKTLTLSSNPAACYTASPGLVTVEVVSQRVPGSETAFLSSSRVRWDLLVFSSGTKKSLVTGAPYPIPHSPAPTPVTWSKIPIEAEMGLE